MSIYHKHHITPKHMGGTNDPENLVKVTVEEHANLHKQLWEDLGHIEDKIAWLALSGQIDAYEATLLAIRTAQKKRIGEKRCSLTEATKKKISDSKKGKSINYPKNRKSKSKEVCTQISERTSGNKNGFYGKKHSEETKEKIRNSLKKNKESDIIKSVA